MSASSTHKTAWRELLPIAGVSLGVAAAGIKNANQRDLAVMKLCEGATVVGVFTQNAFAAAPVVLCREHLASRADIRALVVNSGNANACTGEQGIAAAAQTCDQTAELLGIDHTQVLPFSTGVIGEALPIDKLSAALPGAFANTRDTAWEDFARAIMTTDTRPKGESREINWEEHTIRVSGVAKGAGMINPNMATMLAFVATDAALSPDLLDQLSRKAAHGSFNRITIDGDTSTNDACMLIATGKSGAPTIDRVDHPLFMLLDKAVCEVYRSLAQQIVRDGEGASKFVEVRVDGGATPQESLDVAYVIAHSPLVKTALFASDPNWGRIVAAIGNAGINDLDASAVRVWIDDVLIVDHGAKAASYREEAGQRVFNKADIGITVDLGRGQHCETLWTSDLSHEYVRINAEYRT